MLSAGDEFTLCCVRRDAKLSVLEWDSSCHDVRTTSMHYFEGDPTLCEGRKASEVGRWLV